MDREAVETHIELARLGFIEDSKNGCRVAEIHERPRFFENPLHERDGDGFSIMSLAGSEPGE
jgi:hypothetical protein